VCYTHVSSCPLSSAPFAKVPENEVFGTPEVPPERPRPSGEAWPRRLFVKQSGAGKRLNRLSFCRTGIAEFRERKRR